MSKELFRTCPESGLPGIDNQAVRFQSGDYIDLSGSTDDLGVKDGSFTVMGWVKGKGTLFGVQPDDNGYWLSAGISGNRPSINWTHASGTSGTQSPSAINTGKWND